MTVAVRTPADLGLESVERIAFGGEPVVLETELLEHVRACRAQTVAVLERSGRVYGVTTGLGYRVGEDVPPGDQRSFERSLLLGRAVGSEPFLPLHEARAVLAVRLAGLVRGHAGVTAELCERLAACLNTGFTPAIPRRSIGCAGEIIPLAHAFGTLLGAGSVLRADGSLCPAAAALEEHGFAPLELQPKEGIALLGGAPGAVALGLARRRQGRRLVRHTLVAAAAAADALSAPLDPYAPALGRVSEDPLLEDVLTRFHRLLAGGGAGRTLQAPVSFRVAPQVQAHAERTLARFDEDLGRSLAALTDSPALVEGRFVANGGFHQVDVAAGMDAVAAALARLAELSAQRIHRLLDGRFSGLPDQLASGPGPRAGLVLVHKRVVGTLHELRRLAAPASVGSVDTSMGQEDAMTFAFDAAEKLREALALTRDVVACELLAARQAWWLRRQGGGRSPAPRLASTEAFLEETVPPVIDDRPLGGDVARLALALEQSDPPIPQS